MQRQMIIRVFGKRREIIRGILLVLCIPLTIFCIIPLPESIESELKGSLRLQDCKGRHIAQLSDEAARLHIPIDFASMGTVFPDIMVQLEDHRFYAHHGIDYSSLIGSLVRNLRSGRVVSGASTITQQLIKAETSRIERSITAKLYEMVAALKIEKKWSKEQILERYLNRISFSNRLIGIEAAANVYFGKVTADLTLGESIFLAGLPQSPTRYSPWRKSGAAVKRYQTSIDRLLERGIISREQATALRNNPPVAGKEFQSPQARHYVEVMVKRYPQKKGVFLSSLNLEIQKLTEQAGENILRELRHHRVKNVAALVMENETGMIRAMTGSGSWESPEGQINGTLIRRGAGSTLKPFLYATAFEMRKCTPATLLPDTPDAISKIYSDYSPRNFDHRFWGPVRAREALGCSMNIPAVFLIHKVGVVNTYNRLQKMGFGFQKDYSYYGAGLALGNPEIRLIDLVEAFSLFARKGKSINARFLVEDPIVETAHFSEEISAILCHILSDTKARVRSFGANSPLDFNEKVPCKTGTSSSFRDNWTIGSTNRHTIGVWMGNFTGETSNGVSAASGSAKVFQSIVQGLLAAGDTGVTTVLPELKNLMSTEICSLTGLLPGKNSRDVLTDWFLKGTEPNTNADTMIQSANDEREDLLLPPEYSVWCDSPHNWLQARVDTSKIPVTITNPNDGDEFHLVSYLPKDQQMLLFKGTGGDKDSYVWLVDGERVDKIGHHHMWPLKAGNHRVVLQSKLQSHEITIRVFDDSDSISP